MYRWYPIFIQYNEEDYDLVGLSRFHVVQGAPTYPAITDYNTYKHPTGPRIRINSSSLLPQGNTPFSSYYQRLEMASTTREDSHAGSWYTDDGDELDQQLESWLAAVPSPVNGIGAVSAQEAPVSIPVPGARAIIAPHAGYAYSGPAAAWAYKSVDWCNAKRVFLLGPSHHKYFTRAVTTKMDKYRTLLGDLVIDKELVDDIAKKWNLDKMSKSVDEAEHSLEMHLPYIYKMLSSSIPNFSNDPSLVKLIPIVVGNTNTATEKDLGRLLAPHLTDPSNIFVISSDFAHWGSRFSYTYYHRRDLPNKGPENLNSRSYTPKEFPIHESIKTVDFESMAAVESGSHDEFVEQLRVTGNTVCGRHPIGVFMAAVEACQEVQGKGKFKFVRYERSGLVKEVSDSSVSYCSAFSVF